MRTYPFDSYTAAGSLPRITGSIRIHAASVEEIAALTAGQIVVDPTTGDRVLVLTVAPLPTLDLELTGMNHAGLAMDCSMGRGASVSFDFVARGLHVSVAEVTR